MPASEAQIRANQANAQKSTGPTTPSGKEASRANSYKHGLTGSGTVLPEQEAAEVQRRYTALGAEFGLTGEVAATLILRAARMSVRLDLCADHQATMAKERIRKALADHDVPEGLDEAALAKLRGEVSILAMFDSSPEAMLARKYEADSERSFHRALKELRQMQKARKAAQDDLFEEKLASFLPGEMTDDEFDRLEAEVGSPSPRKPSRRVESDAYAELKRRINVPISVGKRR